MMMSDYLATEAKPLKNLAAGAPWYVAWLAWIGVAFVVLSWVALRRWLGAWVPLLAYIVFLVMGTRLVAQAVYARFETIELARPLDVAELEPLENAVGERVYYTVATGRPPRLQVRRDAEVQRRAAEWLDENNVVRR